MGGIIYFNPNMDPDEYYPILKVSALIYDKIYLWSPKQDKLEQHGFAAADFFELCKGNSDNPPAIFPCARDRWFHYGRDITPREETERADRTFRKQIKNVCETYGRLIVPSEIYKYGYKLADEFDLSDSKIVGLTNVFNDFGYEHKENVNKTSIELSKSLEWATLNCFIQDLLACKYVGAREPMASRGVIQGYQYLSEEDSSFIDRDGAGTFKADGYSEHVLDKITGFSAMSAKDIFYFRSQHMNELNQFIDKMSRDRLLGLGERELEDQLKNMLEGDIRTADHVARIGVPLLTSGVIYHIILAMRYTTAFASQILSLGAGAASLIIFLLLGKYRTKITRTIARGINLNSPDRRMLLNSTYAATALYKFTRHSG